DGRLDSHPMARTAIKGSPSRPLRASGTVCVHECTVHVYAINRADRRSWAKIHHLPYLSAGSVGVCTTTHIPPTIEKWTPLRPRRRQSSRWEIDAQLTIPLSSPSNG